MPFPKDAFRGPLERVYDAVVVRLIAAFYPACRKEVTSVAGESNGVPFRARGVRVLEPGWTALYPRKDEDRKDDGQDLPEFRPGESGPHEPFVRRGETTPPKPFTESTLLGAMEAAGMLVDDEQLKEALKERGLGRPATRAAIIETLLARGYIVRVKKALAGTDLGRYLVALVRDRALKSPELTGEWEAKLIAFRPVRESAKWGSDDRTPGISDARSPSADAVVRPQSIISVQRRT